MTPVDLNDLEDNQMEVSSEKSVKDIVKVLADQLKLVEVLYLFKKLS